MPKKFEFYPRNRHFRHPLHLLFFLLFYLPPRTFVSNKFTSCLPSASSKKHFCIYLRLESPLFFGLFSQFCQWAILEFRCNNFRETAYQQGSLSAERGRLENRNRWTWTLGKRFTAQSIFRLFSWKKIFIKIDDFMLNWLSKKNLKP